MSGELLMVIGLLAAGLVLVALEVFLIPGVGMVAVAGGLSLLLGSALTLMWFGAEAGAAALLLSIVGPLLLLWILVKSSAGNKLVLGSALSRAVPDEARALRVGAQGRALTPLRPSGRALFGEQPVDVVTDGVYVDAGEPVRIVELAGNRVVVATIPAGTALPRKT